MPAARGASHSFSFREFAYLGMLDFVQLRLWLTRCVTDIASNAHFSHVVRIFVSHEGRNECNCNTIMRCVKLTLGVRSKTMYANFLATPVTGWISSNWNPTHFLYFTFNFTGALFGQRVTILSSLHWYKFSTFWFRKYRENCYPISISKDNV